MHGGYNLFSQSLRLLVPAYEGRSYRIVLFKSSKAKQSRAQNSTGKLQNGMGLTRLSVGSKRSSYLRPYFLSSVPTACWYLVAAQAIIGSNIFASPPCTKESENHSMPIQGIFLTSNVASVRQCCVSPWQPWLANTCKASLSGQRKWSVTYCTGLLSLKEDFGQQDIPLSARETVGPHNAQIE